MSILEKFLHLVFPSGCVYCGRLSDDRVHGFCKECYNSLSIFLRKTDFTWYIFDYDKKIAKILQRAKYGGKPGAVKVMAGLLGEFLKEKSIKADLVIPVPMYKKDLGERGYNQSRIAAGKIARVIESPCKDRALTKIKRTKRQADLSKSARGSNLSGAFSADVHIVKDKVILLVDDIITTGSTLIECRNTLLEAGAKSVEAAVIAHTPLKKK